MKKLIKLMFGISLTAAFSTTVISCSRNKIKLSETDIANIINNEFSKSDSYFHSMEEVTSTLVQLFMQYNNYVKINSIGNLHQEGYLIKANKIEETTSKINFSITAQKIEKVESEFIVSDSNFYNENYKAFKWVNKINVDNDKFETDFYNKNVSIKILNLQDLDGISYEIKDGKDQVENCGFDPNNKSIFNITMIPNINSNINNQTVIIIFKAKNVKPFTIVEIKNVIKDYDPVIKTDLENSELSTKWGNRIEFNILNYSKYKNLKVSSTSYSDSLIEDFVINNGKVMTTMLYKDDKYNTFFQNSYFWLNIIADDIPAPTKIKVIINPISPFINNNDMKDINLEVGKEKEIVFDKKIKNKKLYFNNALAKKYLLFKNGNVESDSVDYSNLDKMIVEGWIYNESEDYISCKYSFDKDFSLVNNYFVTKNLVYNFTFTIEKYSDNDIKINDQTIKIQSDEDSSLKYEINNSIVNVFTKADNFYLKIKTEEFRKFNSIIKELFDSTDIDLKYTFDINQYNKEYCDIKISYSTDPEEKLNTYLIFGYNQYKLTIKINLT
ncbi:hypothetical protein [Spiroplasma tabanidicola]|uniref:Lipoprotein n=1 Tax=Spiroplasma tabanidicola TaxID=324079 RepID=A0A6I6C4T4_9MOLU|nr:hypothetical protein [Spiroplasma tabanidicola]QGS51827.1 hypothetical protein STABA_v1c04640 [Spiroplasma tabanidicola]